MRCVIFDVDGTLFDTKLGIIAALNKTIGVYGGIPISEKETDKYIGPSVHDSLISFQDYSEEQANEATRYYRRVYVEEYIYESIMYDGVLNVLEYLEQSGDVMAIATMKTRAQVEKLLNMYAVADYFSIIKYAAEDGSLTKKKMLEQIRKDINADEYIMIGDTEGDYKAAIANGLDFVFADYGYGECEKTDKRMNCIMDLIATLERSSI